METPKNLIESLFERFEAYCKTTLELTKLRALKRLVFVLTTLVTRLAVAAMGSFFILFLNIGIALFLGEKFGKMSIGFFIVAIFYLVLGLILYFFLFDWIKKPMQDLIFKQSFQNKNHDE
jgi:Zn-dependent protease with chaperone function